MGVFQAIELWKYLQIVHQIISDPTIVSPHTIREVEPRSWRGVLDTTLCDNVCQ
jgi:hypothetical protein